MSNNPKIFVDYKNNRFINGLVGSDQNDLQIVHAQVNKNIYNIYYSLNFNYCIFNLSSLDNEVAQFISEYSSKIKTFIYFDIHNYTDTGLIDAFKDNIYYLVPENTYSNYANYANVIKINTNLVNKNIFRIDDNVDRDPDAICVFLDLFESIPEQLMDKLYPKTKTKIIMYNNPKIKHAQNVGPLSEVDRAYVLNRSSYFVNYSDHYIYEAICCGCKILDINNIDTQHCVALNENITSYDNLLKEHIL